MRVEIFESSQRQGDFDPAVTHCKTSFMVRRICNWPKHMDSGVEDFQGFEEPIEMRQCRRLRCDFCSKSRPGGRLTPLPHSSYLETYLGWLYECKGLLDGQGIGEMGEKMTEGMEERM
jgi:hypothetical protein